MPEGTKVHRCFEKVKKKGHDEGSAAAICQKSTGQSLATGKKTRKSDGKRVGSAKSEGFLGKLDRALAEMHRRFNS